MIKVVKEEVECPKCNTLIFGHGYEMPSKCVGHIQKFHPEDYKRLLEAKQKLNTVKCEFDNFWFHHYF